MDFLRILAINNVRRIKEETISSIFNYLINPYEDHGLREQLLEKITDSIGLNLGNNKRSFWHPKESGDLPSVTVDPESALGKGIGNIDALVTIEKGEEIWIIGLEIKIDDKSAENKSQDGKEQLERYLDFFSDDNKLRDILDREDKGNIQKALVFIIPPNVSENSKCFEKATAVHNKIKELKSESKPIFIVLPWGDLSVSTNTKHGFQIAKKPISKLLEEILKESFYGEISPPNDQALTLIRSLKNAISNAFIFKFDQPREGQYPTYQGFFDGLPEVLKNKYSELIKFIEIQNDKIFIDSGCRSEKIGIAVPPLDYKKNYTNEQLYQLIKKTIKVKGETVGIIRFEGKYKNQDHWDLEKLGKYFTGIGAEYTIESNFMNLYISKNTNIGKVLNYEELMKYRKDRTETAYQKN